MIFFHLNISYHLNIMLSSKKGLKIMTNQDIREEARKAGVRLWQIADELGISEPTITRLMRKELTAEKKAEILKIIAQLKEVDQ